MVRYWQETFSPHNLKKLIQPTNLREDILPLVRKITLLGRDLPKKGEDYLIPDTSFATIPGVTNEVPRGFVQDVIPTAEILIWSLMVPHGLTDLELKKVYVDHCVSRLTTVGERYNLSQDASIAVLLHYMGRVAEEMSCP